MELKEYLQIIKKHKNLFWGIWLGFIVLGLVVLAVWPKQHQAIMSIDITRQGANQTGDEYTFDQYYRLEADDSFAKTVTQWLKDPGVVETIYSQAEKEEGKGTLIMQKRSFKAEQLAPNYIQVKYVTNEPDQAQAIFVSTEKIITERVNLLNTDSQDQNWFKTVFTAPSSSEKELPFGPFLLGVILIGFLVALFGTMTKHYCE